MVILDLTNAQFQLILLLLCYRATNGGGGGLVLHFQTLCFDASPNRDIFFTKIVARDNDHRYLIIPRWLTSNHRPIYKVKPRYLLQM